MFLNALEMLQNEMMKIRLLLHLAGSERANKCWWQHKIMLNLCMHKIISVA